MTSGITFNRITRLHRRAVQLNLRGNDLQKEANVYLQDAADVMAACMALADKHDVELPPEMEVIDIVVPV